MSKIHKSIRVFGAVHGVGYRFWAVEKAKALGLAGFVCNEPDGTVYIEVEGTPAKVDRFIAWCHDGSPSAWVSRTDVSDGEMKDLQGFVIKN